VLRRLVIRRLGVVGLALTAYDVWRILPKRHRRLLIDRGKGAVSSIAADARQRATNRRTDRQRRNDRR
jgi:hypothetical protein